MENHGKSMKIRTVNGKIRTFVWIYNPPGMGDVPFPGEITGLPWAVFKIFTTCWLLGDWKKCPIVIVIRCNCSNMFKIMIDYAWLCYMKLPHLDTLDPFRWQLPRFLKGRRPYKVVMPRGSASGAPVNQGKMPNLGRLIVNHYSL